MHNNTQSFLLIILNDCLKISRKYNSVGDINNILQGKDILKYNQSLNHIMFIMHYFRIFHLKTSEYLNYTCHRKKPK